MKALRTILIAAIAAAFLSSAALASPTASESGKRVLFISNCFKPKFEPAAVVVACGDAGLIVQDVTWSTWTRKSAQGSGTGVAKTCDPDCATGGTVTAPIALTLSKARTCSKGRRIFSKLRYTWTSGSPVGGPSSVAVPFGCKLLNL